MTLRALLARLLVDPYEREPDANRFLPHHALWGVLVFGVGWYLWHPGGDPALGATLALVGLLVALDDVIDHAFGGWIRDATERYLGVRMGTPLDYAYRRLMDWGPFARFYNGLLDRLGY